MRLWPVLSTLCLVFFGSSAVADTIEEKLQVFKKAAREAARDLGVPHAIDVQVDISGKLNFKSMPLQIHLIPEVRLPGFPSGPIYVIFAAREYLERASALNFRFGATHEVCHVKYGHLQKAPRNEILEEIEANTCTCARLGKEDFVSYFVELGHVLQNEAMMRESRENIQVRVLHHYGGTQCR